jgi:hypothetical protein
MPKTTPDKSAEIIIGKLDGSKAIITYWKVSELSLLLTKKQGESEIIVSGVPRDILNPVDRSVEELAKELMQKTAQLGGLTTEDIRQTIQTERQKRDEMVEAERERIRVILEDEIYKINFYIDGGYPGSNEVWEVIEKALTQPNNPK